MYLSIGVSNEIINNSSTSPLLSRDYRQYRCGLPLDQLLQYCQKKINRVYVHYIHIYNMYSPEIDQKLHLGRFGQG
jgi:hypothetical protein